MSDSTQRVRLTVEYDMDVFDGDPEDVYMLADQELDYLVGTGLLDHFPSDADINLSPILEAGS